MSSIGRTVTSAAILETLILNHIPQVKMSVNSTAYHCRPCCNCPFDSCTVNIVLQTLCMQEMHLIS